MRVKWEVDCIAVELVEPYKNDVYYVKLALPVKGATWNLTHKAALELARELTEAADSLAAKRRAYDLPPDEAE